MKIDEFAKRAGDFCVDTVYFGGGTPSLLSPALLGRLLDRASREFTFADGIEISMEANPESMTAKKAQGYVPGRNLSFSVFQN